MGMTRCASAEPAQLAAGRASAQRAMKSQSVPRKHPAVPRMGSTAETWEAAAGRVMGGAAAMAGEVAEVPRSCGRTPRPAPQLPPSRPMRPTAPLLQLARSLTCSPARPPVARPTARKRMLCCTHGPPRARQDGRSPLLPAVLNSDALCVAKLLEHDTARDALTLDALAGRCALHYAAVQGAEPVLAALLCQPIVKAAVDKGDRARGPPPPRPPLYPSLPTPMPCLLPSAAACRPPLTARRSLLLPTAAARRPPAAAPPAAAAACHRLPERGARPRAASHPPRCLLQHGPRTGPRRCCWRPKAGTPAACKRCCALGRTSGCATSTA